MSREKIWSNVAFSTIGNVADSKSEGTEINLRQDRELELRGSNQIFVGFQDLRVTSSLSHPNISVSYSALALPPAGHGKDRRSLFELRVGADYFRVILARFFSLSAVVSKHVVTT